MNKQTPGHEIEQLSAYLDGNLTGEELTKLENRLKLNAGLRQELESLLKTREILRSVPAKRIPRSFVLTPEMVAPKVNIFSRLFPVMRTASLIASMLFILTFFGQLIPGRMLAAAPVAAPVESMAAQAPSEEPPIIIWASPQASSAPLESLASPAEGYGGGGGGISATIFPPQPFPPSISGQAPAEDLAQERSGEETATGLPQAALPAAPAEKAIPTAPPPLAYAPDVIPDAATEAPAAQPSPNLSAADQASELQSTSAAGPILGLPAPEEEGQMQPMANQTVDDALQQPNWQKALPYLQIFLAAIAVITAVLAYTFHKKMA